MGLLASITNLDRKFGWSFLGFVLAVVLGLLTIYTEFWKENAPRLEFEILSNTPVLDVHERLPELEVIYQGQDIAKSGKTLSVLLLRGVNRGSSAILSSHYDAKVPVGLKVAGGELIRAELGQTSNDYLAKAAGIVVKNDGVTFDPTIIEPGEWFIAKLLVLHSVQVQPSVSALGKVAGMHSIAVTTLLPTSETGLWHRAYAGNIWIQIVRAVSYFFVAVGGVLAIVIPSEFLSNRIDQFKRRRIVERFKTKTKISLSAADEFVFGRFMDGGQRYLQRLANAVADPDRLQERVASYLARKVDGEQKPRKAIYSETFLIEVDGHPRMIYPYDVASMIDSGFIVELAGKWTVVPERLKVVTAFLEYLELTGSSDA